MPPRRTFTSLVLVALSCFVATITPVEAAPAVTDARPVLHDSRPCPGQPGFTCSMLTVPADHTGRVRGTLDLQVAAADNADAPKGVMLLLAGGPGQAGVPHIYRYATQRLPEIADDYRLVIIDQRGTGEFGAIDCPELQAEVGSSDIIAPNAAAVRACAAKLGDRAGLYGSDQTVADLDLVRQSLGARKMVLHGTSYGSLVAARYAIAHPRNVEKLILDSVVPHHLTSGVSLYLAGLRVQSKLLRDACAVPPACGFDPAADLAAVVRQRDRATGVRIFDMMVGYGVVDPSLRNPSPAGLPAGSGDVVGALRAARQGDPARLDALLAVFEPFARPIRFSAGLHLATICTDFRFVWGDASTPVPLRAPLLGLAERLLPQQAVWPYTPQVATGQGLTASCLNWPAMRPNSNPSGKLPAVPTLLLSGDKDTSTPLEWAKQEAATAPRGRLVVVKGESHSIVSGERGHAGRDAVIAFLAD
jgi:pimeloyl-ACP methyl ester carboxylesterase